MNSYSKPSEEATVCLGIRLPREVRDLVETRAKKMQTSPSDLVIMCLYRSGLLDKKITFEAFLDRL